MLVTKLREVCEFGSPAEPQEPQLPYNDETTLVIPVVPVEDDDTPDRDDGLTSAVDRLHFRQESATKGRLDEVFRMTWLCKLCLDHLH